ncbi:MAG: hypothetical protein HYR64_00050 [Fimbriimonas ginsengisoli]|uniref:Uncharacterized protein n=1 Tax=Fimbriimonas ginsengisoli TaxID=1005039 RepID=A0A931LTN0_FIMGI|nr:hypothetical protein [Fimbriimonas ginsengisoli]
MSALTVVMIGVALAISLLSWGYFWHWVPNEADAKTWQDYRDKLTAEASKMAQANKRVQDAEVKRDDAEKEWAAIVAEKTPSQNLSEGGIDLSVNSWQFIRDAKVYRNSLQKAINAQLTVGNVKLPNGGPFVPLAPDNQGAILATFFNYPAMPYPVVILDLGVLTVQGTYDQIMASMKSWSKMPHYLAVADGLQLTGTTPHMTGTYHVTVVGFIRGTDIFPPAPDVITGAVAQAGAPGGGGQRAGGAGGGGGRGGGRGGG